jgi:hypothetical protein
VSPTAHVVALVGESIVTSGGDPLVITWLVVAVVPFVSVIVSFAVY